MKNLGGVAGLWAITFWCGLAFSETPGVPIILVKGYGPQFAKLLVYQRFLKSVGVKPCDIHTLEYPQNAPADQLQKQATDDLGAIIAKYPPSTQFDMITHSFGNFVGLYVAMPSQYSGRIRKFISLAGIARGQDSLPTGCPEWLCGKTLPRLVPYMNPFLQSFFDSYRSQIDRLDKCALYSREDNIVHDPADSGALPGGKNVEVRGARHMDFVWKRDLFNIMRTVCYGAASPKGGFAHEWRWR